LIKQPKQNLCIFFGWRNWLGKNSKDIWNLVPLCLIWILWQEWNRRTFEHLERSRDRLLDHFVGTLFDWSRAWGLMNNDSITIFSLYISFCICL